MKSAAPGQARHLSPDRGTWSTTRRFSRTGPRAAKRDHVRWQYYQLPRSKSAPFGSPVNARLDNASTTSVNVAWRLCCYCRVCVSRGCGGRRRASAGGGRGGSSSPGATLAFRAFTCCTERPFLRHSHSDLAPLLPWSAKVTSPLARPRQRSRRRRSQSRARRCRATGRRRASAFARPPSSSRSSWCSALPSGAPCPRGRCHPPHYHWLPSSTLPLAASPWGFYGDLLPLAAVFHCNGSIALGWSAPIAACWLCSPRYRHTAVSLSLSILL